MLTETLTNFSQGQLDEPLSRYTAWKIGGSAYDALLQPSKADELIEAVDTARKHNGTWRRDKRSGPEVGIRSLTIRTRLHTHGCRRRAYRGANSFVSIE